MPIILLCEENRVPLGLYHYRYNTQLGITQYEESFFRAELSSERVMATICECAVALAGQMRKSYRLCRETKCFVEYSEFEFVWQRCRRDIPGLIDPTYCFEAQDLEYVQEPERELTSDPVVPEKVRVNRTQNKDMGLKVEDSKLDYISTLVYPGVGAIISARTPGWDYLL